MLVSMIVRISVGAIYQKQIDQCLIMYLKAMLGAETDIGYCFMTDFTSRLQKL